MKNVQNTIFKLAGELVRLRAERADAAAMLRDIDADITAAEQRLLGLVAQNMDAVAQIARLYRRVAADWRGRKHIERGDSNV